MIFSPVLTIRAKLITFKNDGDYIKCVFEDLDKSFSDKYKYRTITVRPNWCNVELKKGVETMLEYQDAKAGEVYFDKVEARHKAYACTAQWFIGSVDIDLTGSIDDYIVMA